MSERKSFRIVREPSLEIILLSSSAEYHFGPSSTESLRFLYLPSEIYCFEHGIWAEDEKGSFDLLEEWKP